MSYSSSKNQSNSPYIPEVKEFEEKVAQINRVSKKTKGGNKIGFSALVVIGDRKGRVGAALGKAPDVSAAIRKGVLKAKKEMITVAITNGTIPHQVLLKKGACKVLLKPARPGVGLVAGGSVRIVAELAGIKNLVSKILGSNNKTGNVYTTIEALKKLKTPSQNQNDSQ